jgi:hypothetical protein
MRSKTNLKTPQTMPVFFMATACKTTVQTIFKRETKMKMQNILAGR